MDTQPSAESQQDQQAPIPQPNREILNNASTSRRTIAFAIDLGIIIFALFVIPALLALSVVLPLVELASFSGYFNHTLTSKEWWTSYAIEVISGILQNLLFIFLYIILPQWKLNKTLGQKLLGITIQNHFPDKKITLKQAIIRSMFPVFFSVFGSVGLLFLVIDCGWYFWRHKGMTLHDSLSHTTVVRK